MFTVTYEWLKENYGSLPMQIQQTKDWLLRYGKNVSPDCLEEWSKWKHLAEYQVNTENIVELALARIGDTFISELMCHRFLNLLRVPLGKDYLDACYEVKPKIILELGVGGDSAISTAMFLSYLSEHVSDVFTEEIALISVDRNPLGMTWERYKKYLGLWTFIQDDSLKVLKRCVEENATVDMVFIDTIHSYRHTLEEFKYASRIAPAILMDDVTFEGNDFDEEPGGVKRALEDILKEGIWDYKIYTSGSVGLLTLKEE